MSGRSRKKTLALIGADGMLGTMVRSVAPEDLFLLPYDLPGFDITDRDAVLETFESRKPDIPPGRRRWTATSSNEPVDVPSHGHGMIAL